MSHKMLRPFIVKVSVLGYFPVYIHVYVTLKSIYLRVHKLPITYSIHPVLVY